MGGLLTKVLRPVKLVSEYVQTDDIDELRVETILHTPCVKIIKDSLLDPRSVTLGIKRTPIVIITQSTESIKVSEPKLYLETDIDAIDEILTPKRERRALKKEKKSLEVEEPEEGEEDKCGTKVILVYQEEEEVEVKIEKAGVESDEGVLSGGENEDLNKSLIEEVEAVDSEASPLTRRSSTEDLRKRLLLTPQDLLRTPDSIKTKSGRTPLGIVSSNVMKPWKGLDEERRKLGLENTPPSHIPPPLLDASQSAPGKIFRQGRQQQRWDDNNSFVI